MTSYYLEYLLDFVIALHNCRKLFCFCWILRIKMILETKSHKREREREQDFQYFKIIQSVVVVVAKNTK